MTTTEEALIQTNGSYAQSSGNSVYPLMKINVNDQPVLPHHNAFKSYINPCVLVIGILVNSVFIVLSLRIKAMRSATSFYLLNLALANILFLLFGIGEQMLRFHMAVPQERNHLHTSMFGSNGCDWYQLVTTATHFGTLFLFTLITFDRLYCVRNIRRVKISSKRKHFLIGTGLCWFVAVVIATTFLPSFQETTLCGLWESNTDTAQCPQVKLCTSKDSTWQTYRNVMKVFPFFLSVALNFPLYALIVKRLKKAYPTTTDISSGTRRRNRKQITLTLVVSGMLFFLCLLPYQFEVLYEELNRSTRPSNFLLVFRSLALTLVYLYSAVAPLLCVMTSGRYKRAFFQSATACIGCKFSKIVKSGRTSSNQGNQSMRVHTGETACLNHRSQTANGDITL